MGCGYEPPHSLHTRKLHSLLATRKHRRGPLSSHVSDPGHVLEVLSSVPPGERRFVSLRALHATERREPVRPGRRRSPRLRVLPIDKGGGVMEDIYTPAQDELREFLMSMSHHRSLSTRELATLVTLLCLDPVELNNCFELGLHELEALGCAPQRHQLNRGLARWLLRSIETTSTGSQAAPCASPQDLPGRPLSQNTCAAREGY